MDLAVVLGVFSRKIVGWAMALSLHTMVLNALKMAVAQRGPIKVTHSSDQGSQFTSLEFGKRCRETGVRYSMGGVGDCNDNAMARLILGQSFRTFDERHCASAASAKSWGRDHSFVRDPWEKTFLDRGKEKCSRASVTSAAGAYRIVRNGQEPLKIASLLRPCASNFYPVPTSSLSCLPVLRNP